MVEVENEDYCYDFVSKQWYNRRFEQRSSYSREEWGIHSVRAFRRYLRRNKHNFPSGTKVTLSSKFVGCAVFAIIK